MPKLDGRPFVISEYGGYSMILDGHVWNKQKSFGYIMFRSKEKLSAAYKKLHEKQVIPLIKKRTFAPLFILRSATSSSRSTECIHMTARC